MDELQAVRELFAEPAPPRPEVIASTRARLSGRTPLRHRIRLRAAVPVVAMAATASVITAIALQAPPSGVGVYRLPAGAAGARPGTAGAARNILLTAARTVAGAVPPDTGRYWQASAVVGNFITVGPAGGRYLIVEQVAAQQWTARQARAASPDFSRALAVQFASARDRRAWRRDGSPTSWNVDQETSLAGPGEDGMGFDRDITAGRGKLISTGGSLSETGKTFSFGGSVLSARELRALPASPARLKALILRRYSASADPGGAESHLFQVTPALLTLPVTPAVRAALYRMLAGLPGVRSLGQVQDAGGQPGTAVALTGQFRDCGAHARFSSCTVQQRLVIDPHTGLPLAQELRYLKLPAGQAWSAPDGLFSFELFGAARWTNATPPAPGN